jgi:VWFA-related protein
MQRILRNFAVFVAVLLSLGAAAAVQAQGTVPVGVVVTALGPKYTPPPALSQDDINVFESKDKRTVTGFVPAQGDKAALQLAIVIDDATSIESIGNQLSDIKNFINAQAKSTSIGVFYASNGGVQATSPFSQDHEAAAKGIRLPFGNGGAYSSVYLSTMSLMKGWPAPGPYTRREILLIADGIDRFRGDPFSPDIQSTYERAEKEGIIIHTLYATGVGRASRNSFRVSYGQSNLDQLTERTGGESFFQGLQTPISFAPFLEQLDMILKNQYFLGFKMDAVKGKGQLRSFKIKTEQKNVDISAADQVWVAGAPK